MNQVFESSRRKNNFDGTSKTSADKKMAADTGRITQMEEECEEEEDEEVEEEEGAVAPTTENK